MMMAAAEPLGINSPNEEHFIILIKSKFMCDISALGWNVENDDYIDRVTMLMDWIFIYDDCPVPRTPVAKQNKEQPH